MKKIYQKYNNIPFAFKLLGALVLGVLIGLIFKEDAAVIEPIGTLFIRLLSMAALPLICVNMVSAILSLDDPRMLGRIGVKIFSYYMVTTFLAALVGILVANIINPGAAIVLQSTAADAEVGEVPSVVTTLIEMVPKNIFAALSEGSLASAIVFCTFFGISVILLSDKKDKERITNGASSLTRAMFRMVQIIIGFAPFGVAALVASTVGQYGNGLVGFLLKYLGTIAVSCLLMLIIYGLFVLIFTRKSPIAFYKKVIPSMLTAFSTASSLASVPVNIECSKELGVSSKIYGFTIPLGAQINKDGLTLMLATACVAAGQAIGSPLNISLIFTMVLMSVLLTFGAGGVPGGSIVLITLITSMFNFPAEVAGLIAGIFAPIEMLICVPNVAGDVAGTFIVAHSERKHLIEDDNE